VYKVPKRYLGKFYFTTSLGKVVLEVSDNTELKDFPRPNHPHNRKGKCLTKLQVLEGLDVLRNLFPILSKNVSDDLFVDVTEGKMWLRLYVYNPFYGHPEYLLKKFNGI
jgi:hypothetical protein